MRNTYKTYLIQFGFILTLGIGLFINNLYQKYDHLEEEYAQYKLQTETVMTLAHSAFANSEQNFLAQYEMEKELTCLAMNIYFESGNKSYEEKLAIATVTVNRLNSPEFPKTICAVVWQKKPNTKKCQFSWTCDGKSDRIVNSGKYLESLRIARDVLLNQKKSRYIDDDVLHYHAYYIRPDWSRHMTRVAFIGAHLFYREKT